MQQGPRPFNRTPPSEVTEKKKELALQLLKIGSNGCGPKIAMETTGQDALAGPKCHLAPCSPCCFFSLPQAMPISMQSCGHGIESLNGLGAPGKTLARYMDMEVSISLGRHCPLGGESESPPGLLRGVIH